MPTNILMPALSPTMEKGNLARWLKKEGDKIKSGDVIAEIETDKATMEVEATDEGTLGRILIPEGTADVLEVKSSDGTATRLFLDSTTHVPLMMTWNGGGQRGGRGGQGGFRGAPAQEPQAGAAVDAAQGRRGRGAGGAPPATLEMHLSDYKVVNGVKLPHLITRGTNGQTAEEWAIKSYRINPNFKGNTFTK